MSDDGLSPALIREATAFVDIEAPPPDGLPTAHLVFGTNQIQPIEHVAARHHRGLAPLIIVTGGVNRHTGIIEGQWFLTELLARDVPEAAVRCEDRSADTWQNVENSLPRIHEALASGLRITAVSKWYHRRALHCLATQLPALDAFHAHGWDPVYAGQPVTRASWPSVPDGERRVLREWRECSRRVSEGTFRAIERHEDVWT
ncbi:YdcF family protein [Spirillospora sp. NPDC052269]